MKSLFFALAVALLSIYLPAKTLKIATAYPEGTEAVKHLRLLAKELKEASDGKLSLKIYPAGAMGSDSAVKRKMQIGQLHGTLSRSSAWSEVFPALRTYGQPFFFSNSEQVFTARSILDKAILENDESANGFRLLGIVDGGLSYLFSKTAIGDLNQLKRAKLWLPFDPALQYYAKAFALNAQSLEIGEVGPALSTGAINAIVAPPSAAITLRWHTQAEFFNPQPVMYTMGVLVFSKSAFKGLTDEETTLLSDLSKKWINRLDSKSRIANQNATKALAGIGLTQQMFSEQSLQELKHQALSVWQDAVKDGWVDQPLFETLSTISSTSQRLE